MRMSAPIKTIPILKGTTLLERSINRPSSKSNPPIKNPIVLTIISPFPFKPQIEKLLRSTLAAIFLINRIERAAKNKVK